MANGVAFKSEEELGQWYIDRHPEHKGRDPGEIGRVILPQMADQGVRIVDEYSDIDFGKTASAFPESWKETAVEQGKAMLHMATTNPLAEGDPAKGEAPGILRVLPRLALGAASAGGEWADDMLQAAGHDVRIPGPLSPPVGLLQMLSALGRGVDTVDDWFQDDPQPITHRQQVEDKGRPPIGQSMEDERQLFRGMIDDYTDSFHPANIERDPANALANATSALPLGAAQIRNLSLLNKLGKGGKATAWGASLISPDLAVESIPGLVKAGIQRTPEGLTKIKDMTGRSETLTKLANATKEGAQRLGRQFKVGDRPPGRELVSTVTGITAGRTSTWARELLKRNKDPVVRRRIRHAKSQPEQVVVDRLQRRALTGANKLREQMKTMYDNATNQFFGGKNQIGPAIETGDLTQKISQSLERVGVTVVIPRVPGPDEFEGVYRRRKQGPIRLDFDDSFVTEIGPARALLEREIAPLLEEMKRGQMSARELHRRRKLIDDAISTLNAESEVSATARTALTDVRAQIADHLEKGLGPAYEKLMREYRGLTVFEDDLRLNMNLRPGQIDRHGYIAEGTQAPVVRGVLSSLGDDLLSHKNMANLERLEELTGVRGIVDLSLAAASQAWAGGGLIVRNELAQFGREGYKGVAEALGVVGTGAGVGALISGGGGALIGGIATLPAMALFSPTAMSATFLAIPEIADFVRRNKAEGMNKYHSMRQRIAETLNGMDKITGGELRARAMRESWNVQTMLERFEIQEEDGE